MGMICRKLQLQWGNSAFCPHGEKLPQQGGLPSAEERVACLSKLLWGNEKLLSEQKQKTRSVHRVKVNPEVIDVPWGT